MTHELKILPEYFQPVFDGTKNFEIRKDDRQYQVGDILILRETNGHSYTGREVRVVVTYILRDRNYNKEGLCTMSIKPLENIERIKRYCNGTL